VGLHDILSPSACTLKVLDLNLSLYEPLLMEGFYEGLEAMTGHYMLEALSLEVDAFSEKAWTQDFVGSIFQNVEKVLVRSGWSALKQVSFKFSFCGVSSSDSAKFLGALQSLPDKYLSHLPKLESIAFNFSACEGSSSSTSTI
jgi:hypothetical protein